MGRPNERGQMLIHLEWASPVGTGPFPAVLVHPEAGHPASDMRGVIRDLANHGYLAVAADYQRVIRGRFRHSLLADATAALEIVRSHSAVDSSRLATLGFSQGGVFSLLIAAQATDIKAAVAYYPALQAWDATLTWLHRHLSNPASTQ